MAVINPTSGPEGTAPASTRALLVATLRPYRWVVLVVIVFSVIASLFDGLSIAILVPLLARLQQAGPASPIRLGWLLGWLEAASPRMQIYLAIGVVVAASLLKNACTALAIRVGHWLSARLLADLRMRAMTVLLNAGMAFHQRSRLGELIDRTITGTFTAEGLIRLGIEFSAGCVTLVVLGVVLVLLSWKLTLVIVPVAGLFAWWMRRHAHQLRQLGHAVAEANHGVAASIHEALAGIALIKSYSQEARYLTRLAVSVEASRGLESRRRFRMFWIHPATDMAGTLVMALLVIVALQSSDTGTQALLTRLLPFLYVLLRTVPLLKILNGQRVELINHWSQIRLLGALLDPGDKAMLRDGTSAFPGLRDAIELRHVSFAYEGQTRPALDDVSLRIQRGQTTAIIGESGSGKSTLSALLLRLHDPTEGVILIDGRPLGDFTLSSYHAAVGIVSQDTFLFNDSVRANIGFGSAREPTEAEVIDAARQAGAHDFVMELPQGYDTELGDRGVRLSGGQRQRIAIARAMIRSPEILILDEATSALDSATEARILQTLRALGRDRTVVIIAHRFSTIEHADWVVEFGRGKVLQSGSAEFLLGVGPEPDSPGPVE